MITVLFYLFHYFRFLQRFQVEYATDYDGTWQYSKTDSGTDIQYPGAMLLDLAFYNSIVNVDSARFIKLHKVTSYLQEYPYVQIEIYGSPNGTLILVCVMNSPRLYVL